MNLFRIPKPIRKVRTCKACGASFSPHRERQSAGFCSPKCWYGTRTKCKARKCAYCGVEFANRNALKYCSRKCFIQKSADSKVRRCKQCRQPWTIERPSLYRNFCSKRCEGDSRRTQPEITVNCPGCLRDFTYRQAGGRKRTYCSVACSSKHRIGEQHPCFRGNRRGYRGANWLKQAQLARDRDGNTCTGCGASTPTKIPVDHLIPFRVAKTYSDTRDPNDLINLTCLCKSCHAKKTGAENAILRGDIIGFIARSKVIIPLERLEAALEFWGLYKHHNGGKPCPKKVKPVTT